MTDFVHLRVQSSYSMLESALKINQIAELAQKLKIPAIGLTDRNNLFGSLEFALAVTKKGIQPIHGVICTIALPEPEYSEIVLLAKDEVGYKNLLKIASYPYIKNSRTNKQYITLEDLYACQEGLILLSGYLEGPIGQTLLKQDYQLATQLSQQFLSIFGDRFYFEIMRHNLEQEYLIEQDYLKLAAKLDIPLVATNKVLFSEISMYEAHDILLCIAQGARRSERNRRTSHNQYYLKSSEEMQKLFADLPEAISNTAHLAQRCYVMAETREPMLPSFHTADYKEEDLLRKDAQEGLIKRLEISALYNPQVLKKRAQYVARLEYELEVICKMNYAGYFLIVADFISWSKQNNIAVGPGRGSGAGSIVAWCIGITEVDPLEYGLLFERFLNPERISMPDFDIDFCQENREKVINYVVRKYGHQRVAQIITFGKLQAKAVIKDVARAMALPYKYADYLSELVPFNAVNPVTLEQAFEEVNELKQAAAGKGLYIAEAQEKNSNSEMNLLIREVLAIALHLEGLHRHVSVHAAGLVISGTDLLDIVPLYRDSGSSINIIQYSMKYAELGGLVKFDFLGLQTLTVLSKCCQLLEARGVRIDLTSLPLDDAKTFEIFSKGSCKGVFQFESTGIQGALRKAGAKGIKNIGDIAGISALYRPGPMDNLATYINYKHGVIKGDYMHPSLEPILEETGVPIYQEQVLEIAKTLAGYSLGKADMLRRAMGKKIKSEMDEHEALFIAGAAKNHGVPATQAQNIFRTLAKFAGYGFNKSHAVAYGYLSYQTAYLKANHPREFLIACLNLDMADHDKVQLFLEEGRKYGLSISLPDINISKGYFTAAEQDTVTINFALGAIRGVSKQVGEVIAETRLQKGEFLSVADFIEKMAGKGLNKKILEGLVKAGAFDKLKNNRQELFNSIPKLLAYAEQYFIDRNANQLSLLTHFDEQSIIEPCIEWSYEKKAYHELEVLGLFLSAHPLVIHEQVLKVHNIIDSKRLEILPYGKSEILIGGVIHQKLARMSGRGRFIILKLSDLEGLFEVTIFDEEVLRQYAQLLEVKNLVVLSCEVNKDVGNTRLTVNKVMGLAELKHSARSKLQLQLKNSNNLEQLLDFLQKNTSKKNTNVDIELSFKVASGFCVKVRLPDCFLIQDLGAPILQELQKQNKSKFLRKTT